ncbi:type II toxin-antitoxin system Phd/YefM family antitoxin [Nonomuraea sp. NPDC049158]|uniref:type II toxin-antitoxin system Phd/YefM family antitoxin n=1 Tax=Nonomuraea sp. NPDC049158 TaxID=3155649 RepID=UPI0033FAA28F
MEQLEETKGQLEGAKQRFSELVRRARDEGPQIITRHRQDVAVIMDVEEYRRLKGESWCDELLRRRDPLTSWAPTSS